MKKLTALLFAFIILLAIVGCSGGQTGPTNRGTLTVAYDNALTGELLNYFQANQNVAVTGILLDAETDVETLAAGVALLKDEALAQKLLDAGWTETQNWTELQKQTNEEMFAYTVLVSPHTTESDKIAGKFLTDWLVGDGVYDRTITTVSGGCSCKRVETTVTMKSDAPALFKSGMFDGLAN